MSLTSTQRVFSFPGLNEATFRRLPPMLADSLPDKFGNSIIDASLAREGISGNQITALDRLAYIGSRGMGALEYQPETGPTSVRPTAIDLSELVQSARLAIHGRLDSEVESLEALNAIISVGSSAGGARAKAVLNYNPSTGVMKSGQLPLEPGFEAWLLKFDGLGEDRQLGATQHYGRIEYAYSLMAAAAGIQVPETRLLEEHGRAHFMSKRFDRLESGERIHMQSLCGLAEVDFNLIGVNDYAQYFDAINRLSLPQRAMQEGFRRMAFNVAASNCDDHSKNLSFLMSPSGEWSLSPAYDVTHAYDVESVWNKAHLMSVNGKFQEITANDLLAVADRWNVAGAKKIIRQVSDAVSSWGEFAFAAGIPAGSVDEVAADLVSI